MRGLAADVAPTVFPSADDAEVCLGCEFDEEQPTRQALRTAIKATAC
jgi:hypothetical protein